MKATVQTRMINDLIKENTTLLNQTLDFKYRIEKANRILDTIPLDLKNFAPWYPQILSALNNQKPTGDKT